MDEEALRARARVKLKGGDLPREPEVRLWGGPGFGLPCAVCDIAIPLSEMEYEAQFPAGYTLKVFRFHRICHAVWQLERVREFGG
jgi:hypothetical protein